MISLAYRCRGQRRVGQLPAAARANDENDEIFGKQQPSPLGWQLRPSRLLREP